MTEIIMIFLFCASMAYLVSCIRDWRKVKRERAAEEENRLHLKEVRDRYHGEVAE